MPYSALLLRLSAPLLLARALLVLLDKIQGEAADSGDKPGLTVTVKVEL